MRHVYFHFMLKYYREHTPADTLCVLCYELCAVFYALSYDYLFFVSFFSRCFRWANWKELIFHTSNVCKTAHIWKTNICERTPVCSTNFLLQLILIETKQIHAFNCIDYLHETHVFYTHQIKSDSCRHRRRLRCSVQVNFKEYGSTTWRFHAGRKERFFGYYFFWHQNHISRVELAQLEPNEMIIIE